MINCNATITLSPLTSRPFCKIVFDSFDIEYDKVQNLMRECGLSFNYEYSDIKSVDDRNVLITSIKNYYYYSRRQSQEGKSSRLEVILSNLFFNTTGITYDDILGMLNNDSGIILMNIKSSSENFSKMSKLLCKVNVKELKICR